MKNTMSFNPLKFLAVSNEFFTNDSLIAGSIWSNDASNIFLFILF